MRSHGAMKDEEAIDAAKEATRGAVYGAVKWGALAGILGGIGYLTSPLYRSLTIQFKVYIQMSGMAFGSMVEADSRIRQYEAHVRMQRRIARDRAMWQKFEEEYGNDDDE